MPVSQTKPSEVVDLSKHRSKQKGKAKLGPPSSALAALMDLPAVVVKTKDGRAAEIINLPMRDAGADMVLHLISSHPDASLYTRDGDYVRLDEIVMVIDPERGEVEVEAAHGASVPGAGPIRPIQVKMSMREDARIGLMNIPDTEEGHALFRYVLEQFSTGRDGQRSGYTLFTTDYGYIPVHEFAKANAPPKRNSDDENPSR